MHGGRLRQRRGNLQEHAWKRTESSVISSTGTFCAGMDVSMALRDCSSRAEAKSMSCVRALSRPARIEDSETRVSPCVTFKMHHLTMPAPICPCKFAQPEGPRARARTPCCTQTDKSHTHSCGKHQVCAHGPRRVVVVADDHLELGRAEESQESLRRIACAGSFLETRHRVTLKSALAVQLTKQVAAEPSCAIRWPFLPAEHSVC